MRHVDRGRYIVGCQRALTIGNSEPEPDLVVRERDTPKPYHPSSAVLVIEVAASSLPVDLAVKAPLYASAGIAEYWVLDLDGRRAIVHREPERRRLPATPRGARRRAADQRGAAAAGAARRRRARRRLTAAPAQPRQADETKASGQPSSPARGQPLRPLHRHL